MKEIKKDYNYIYENVYDNIYNIKKTFFCKNMIKNNRNFISKLKHKGFTFNQAISICLSNIIYCML